MYADGELTGTYGDLMSALEQITDATASYVLRLTDSTQVYKVAEDYTWPEVEKIYIQGGSFNDFVYVYIQGENTLHSDFGLKGVVFCYDPDVEEPGFTLNLQNHTMFLDSEVHIRGEHMVRRLWRFPRQSKVWRFLRERNG